MNHIKLFENWISEEESAASGSTTLRKLLKASHSTDKNKSDLEQLPAGSELKVSGVKGAPQKGSLVIKRDDVIKLDEPISVKNGEEISFNNIEDYGQITVQWKDGSLQSLVSWD